MNVVSRVQFFDLPSTPLFPTFISVAKQNYPDLIYFDQESASIIFAKNNGFGVFQETKVIAKNRNVTFMKAANLNNDGIDDFIIVRREENLIEVFLSPKIDSGYTSTVYSVSFYPDQVIIADITNDKIPDILCIGKISSGITLLTGKKNFTFREAKILFPDVPVSELHIAKINGDQIPDFIMHNWLTNEEIIYLGLGNLQFSRQLILQFQNDTSQVTLGDFTNDGLTDIVIISSQNRNLQLYEGDGLGGFQVIQSITTTLFPSEVLTTNFNNLQNIDVILNNSLKGQFSIVSSQSNGSLHEEIVFGCEEGNGSIAVSDLNGDGFTDIIRFTGTTHYEIFWNGKTNINWDSISTSFYAVGKEPVAFVTGDFNSDGIIDLAVANTISSTISVLLNTQQYNFSSRNSFEVVENPIFISEPIQIDTAITFLLRHQNAKKISILMITSDTNSTRELYNDIISYSIPIREQVSSVYPDMSAVQSGINFFITNLQSSNAITYFQQVKETRFITKNLIPLVPSKIIAATVSDLNNDKRTDLIYLLFDEKLRNYFLGTTLNDVNSEFKGISQSYALKDSAIKKATIIMEDVNGDNIKDCIYILSPANSLNLAYGFSNGSLNRFTQIDSNITVFGKNDIQVFDFDNDGINDLLIVNRKSSELFLYRGKGNGKYFSKQFISDIPQQSSFRCADFNNDGKNDIAYTIPKNNCLAIHYASQ